MIEKGSDNLQRMACRGCLECILKLLNFLLTLLGLAMVAYGIYLLVEYNKVSGDTLTASSVDKDNGLIQLGRPILMAVSLSASSIFDNLPKAWYGTMATVLLTEHFMKFLCCCYLGALPGHNSEHCDIVWFFYSIYCYLEDKFAILLTVICCHFLLWISSSRLKF